MDVTTGVVVNGKIEVEGETLPEGSKVGVFLPGETEPFELSPKEAEELNRAVDEIQAGRFVDGNRHLASLRHKK